MITPLEPGSICKNQFYHKKKIFVAFYPGEGLILNIAESTQPLAGTQKICYICFSCCAIPILHVNRNKLCTLIS